MHPMLNIAIKAARNASKPILQAMDHMETVKITHKGRHDLTTEVDKFAEQAIIADIHKAYPNHCILAEESGYQKNSDQDHCWIIDPLNGTTNFVHGFPQFAISIAFQTKGKLIAGVIYDPLRQELFTAVDGKGAQMNNRRIRVTTTSKLDEALLGTGFPFRNFEHSKHYLKVFEHLFPQASGIRRAGSAALDLAYVAAGRLDGFWEASLKPWDIAAGALLIKEAGGMISDFQGTDQFMESGNVVAGNPKIFEAVKDVIEEMWTV